MLSNFQFQLVTVSCVLSTLNKRTVQHTTNQRIAMIFAGNEIIRPGAGVTMATQVSTAIISHL